MPVTLPHLSFSSLKSYLSNPAGFYRQYVKMERTNTLSSASLVGRVIHKYLESYYRGMKRKDIQALTESFFNEMVPLVGDWGKTGSPEKAKGEVLAAIRDLKRSISRKSLPTSKAEIYNVEEPVIVSTGLAIPIKAIPDLVVCKFEGLDVYDWKKVSATNATPPPLYYLQAYFNLYAIEKSSGMFVRGMTFVEIKPLKETDTQLKRSINPLYIPFSKNCIEFRATRRLIDFMLEDLNGEARHYLPNITDFFAGDEEWAEWLKETANDPAYAVI